LLGGKKVHPRRQNPGYAYALYITRQYKGILQRSSMILMSFIRAYVYQ